MHGRKLEIKKRVKQMGPAVPALSGTDFFKRSHVYFLSMFARIYKDCVHHQERRLPVLIFLNAKRIASIEFGYHGSLSSDTSLPTRRLWANKLMNNEVRIEGL